MEHEFVHIRFRYGQVKQVERRTYDGCAEYSREAQNKE